MRIHSIRFKLTLLYATTVALLLGIFIGADMYGLHENLMQQAETHSLSPDALEAAWLRAIWEHVSLALVLVVFVFLFGYWFIRRALRPVRNMAATARAISEKDLSLRLDKAGDEAEFGELSDTLNDMIARLEASFLRVKRFSADAAHELSTPLATLQGEIEITLRKERSKEAYKESLGNLHEQAKRLGAIVDNLLFLSRADERALSTRKAPLSLDNLLIRASERFIRQAKEKSIAMHLDNIDSVRIDGDEENLARMLDNLLGNAVKYTPEGGRITLRLYREPERFRMQIIDTGIGIPPEEIPNLFNRFYRVEKSRSSASGGAGLGLSIVEEIVQAHKMDIALRSEQGEGTEITITGKTRAD